MKLAAWFVVACLDVALMIGVYRSERDAGGVTPISSGMIVAVRSTQQTFDGPIPFPSIRAGVTHLPASGISAMVAMSASSSAERMQSLQFRISEKVIQVAFKKVGIDQSTLAWGKLPRVGADEVLAGADVSRRERIHVGETSYTVVSVNKSPSLARRLGWTRSMINHGLGGVQRWRSGQAMSASSFGGI